MFSRSTNDQLIATSPPPAGASSMQKLMYYADRMLRHQLSSDTPALHPVCSSVLPLPFVDAQYSSKTKKRRFSETDDAERSDCDVLNKSLSWNRKDLTQKEEYQFLESDPFMDFADMTYHFPAMQQRTFYRWKRRIKDQFMFLEEHPLLLYEKFSEYYPQVKEHVFGRWHALILNGQHFIGEAGSSITDSDNSMTVIDTLSSGDVAKSGVFDTMVQQDFSTPYNFLQKHFSMDPEQFFLVRI